MENDKRSKMQEHYLDKDELIEEERLKTQLEIFKKYPKILTQVISLKWKSAALMGFGFIIATAFSFYLIDLLMRYIEKVFGQIGTIGSIIISLVAIFISYSMLRKGWSDWEKEKGEE